MSHQTAKLSAVQKLRLTALFAALICAATSIMVPLPFGYFNLGDIMILCAAWMMGPLFGAASAAVGSALADVIMGYIAYAPATFVVKGCIALAAAFLFPVFAKLFKKDFPARLISAIVGECIMVGGYFLYEILLTAFGAGEITQAGLAAAALESATGIPFNIVQGVAGIILSTALLPVFRRIFQRNPELAKG